MSSCCNCCAFTSLIGVVFFGITATMVKRENTVFLTHKAGAGLHDITEENVNAKFMVMVYTAVVSHQFNTMNPFFRPFKSNLRFFAENSKRDFSF